MSELLQYSFFVNALLAALLSGIVCGLTGTYIVARRKVFISGGITHASFGGIGIAYFFGLNPMFGAAVFAILSSLGIELLSHRGTMREDSAIGILWSFGMAIGIIFVFLTPGYAPNLMSFLFGSILAVTAANLWLLGALCLLLMIVFGVAWRPIQYVAFDEEFARARRMPVLLIKLALAVVVALTIVLSIRIAGIILVLSLLTIPPTIANLFTRNFGKILLIAPLIGMLGGVAGLLASYQLDIPPGAAIIFMLVLLFLFASTMQWLRKKLPVRS